MATNFQLALFHLHILPARDRRYTSICHRATRDGAAKRTLISGLEFRFNEPYILHMPQIAAQRCAARKRYNARLAFEYRRVTVESVAPAPGVNIPICHPLFKRSRDEDREKPRLYRVVTVSQGARRRGLIPSISPPLSSRYASLRLNRNVPRGKIPRLESRERFGRKA